MSPGTLFVVATPIGNLEDITFRAVRVLSQVAVIACEDTRQTLKLLNHYQLRKPLASDYQPREGQKIPEILGLLRAGKDVALVSDSGTPGISDPGYRLIAEAIRNAIKVAPVPGPNAAASALSVSGLPSHRFVFIGFPPPKAGAARKLLISLAEEEGTLIFYLPTRRVADFLKLVLETMGNRFVVIARELTKIHEEFLRGRVSSLIEKPGISSLKGEAVFLVQGKSRKEKLLAEK